MKHAHNIIKRYIGNDCELEEIVAGCKNNVIKLQQEFNWSEYDKRQIAFFIDKDLSFWLGDTKDFDNNVFVTDEYSVENYVVNSQGFRTWIVHFEGFARARKEEIEIMVSEFQTNVCNFKNKMMRVMANAVVAKRRNTRVSLGDLRINRDKNIKFIMNGNHVDFDIKFDDAIIKKWGITDEDDKEICRQMIRFRENENQYSVRGKWILCFLAELGEFMRLNCNIFAPSLGDKAKLNCTCSVSPTQCLSVLAPYCIEKIPNRLDAFFNKTYKSYLSKF